MVVKRDESVMGIRQYNPITAGRRGASVSDFAELTKGAEPEKSLLRRCAEEGRPQQSGPDHGPASRRRPQAAVPRDRFQARQGRRAGQGRIRFNTIRTATPASRCCTLPTARSDTLSLPTAWRSGQTIENGPDAPPNVGNCLPLSSIPLGVTIHNIEMQPGRGARLCRSAGIERDADGPRGRLGADHAAQRRNSPHSGRAAGPRSARSATPTR